MIRIDLNTMDIIPLSEETARCMMVSGDTVYYRNDSKFGYIFVIGTGGGSGREQVARTVDYSLPGRGAILLQAGRLPHPVPDEYQRKQWGGTSVNGHKAFSYHTVCSCLTLSRRSIQISQINSINSPPMIARGPIRDGF